MSYSNSTRTYNFNASATDGLQLIDLLFPIVAPGSIHNRKDTYDLKLNIYTGGNNIDALLYIFGQNDPIYIGTINTINLTEVFIDLANIIGITKYWQLRLIGLTNQFKLTQYIIDYEARPEPTTFYNHIYYDIGPTKKRVRVLPFTLDCLGEEVSIVPTVDGAAQPPFVVSGDGLKTYFYQFNTDVFGVDYGVSLHACCLFEIYKIHNPVDVQILPIAKRFDQLGPLELFRYGKIKAFYLRLIAFGGTVIPYKLYFQDTQVISSTITVLDSKEDLYEIPLPKTTAGDVIRIELGPTGFDFHRYYIILQCTKSGKDTDIEYISLQDNVQ